MKKGMMSLNLNRTLAALLALILLAAADRALARDDGGDGLDYRRYVVELIDPPLALYDGGKLSVEDDNGPMRMAATAPEVTGESKLNLRSAASMAYLEFLAARQADFQFDLGVFPVQGQGDEGIAFAINRTYQPVNFNAIQ